jgi:hypothetical protein
VSNGAGAPTLAVQATRVNGTAPLAVLFDATGTTLSSGDAFRQVSYSFDFGDERGQTWAVSGASRNVQSGGPVAAHVFDLPGTYTVRVRALNPATGGYSETTLSINVTDPASTYAGTGTVCVSTSANYSGCPSGAVTSTSYPSNWNGKRVLLRRGESFPGIQLLDGNAGVQVGAFGTGAKPRVPSVGVGNWRPQSSNFANDITVMDLEVTGKLHLNIGHRMLAYRNTVLGQGQDIALQFGGPGYFGVDDPYRVVSLSAFYVSRELYMVENTVLGSGSLPIVNVMGDGSRVAVLGNTMGIAQQHTMRSGGLHKSIVAHNDMRGVSNDGIRHVLKLHSGNLNPYADTRLDLEWATRHVVLSNNLFGSSADNNQWTVAVSPQNGVEAEGIEDVLVENNRFARGARTVADLVMAGRRITYRGNSVVGGAALRAEQDVHGEALPTDWKGPYFAN